MWIVSTTTAGKVREGHEEEDVGILADAGFEGIDLSFSVLCGNSGRPEDYTHPLMRAGADDWIAYFGKIKAACDARGLTMVQAHAPWPTYFPGNDERNAGLCDAVKNALAVCGAFGIPFLVVHPYWETGAGWQACREINKAMCRPWIAAAKKHGVGICIENLFGWKNGQFVDEMFATPELARDFIDEMNEEAGGDVFFSCYDTGHANVLHKNLYDYPVVLGRRLAVLHLHGNDGRGDQHLPPYFSTDVFSDRNLTDWEEILAGLAAGGYRGELNFELSCNTLPRELHPYALAYTAAAGRYFRRRLSELTANGQAENR